MEHKQLFPNRLQELRMEYGYKQRDVALLVGIACPTDISKWENGEKLPAPANLMRLCIIYRTSVYDLYEDYMMSLMAEVNHIEMKMRQ